MNIYRNSFTTSVNDMTNFGKDFANLGFTKLDGSSLTTTSFFTVYQDIKWKFDKSASNTNECNHLYLHVDGGRYRMNGETTYYDQYVIEQTNNHFNVVFIPLINDGFILLSYSGSGEGYWGTSAHPTLPILTPNIAKNYQHENNYGYMLIGFRTKIFDGNPFSYIQYGYDSKYGMIAKMHINNMTSIDIPCLDNTVDYQYTELHNDMCTLVKMPYNSTYVDNVYLCTTSPFPDGVEGKTFSFGGRNFFGAYNNLVFELPKD